MNKDLSWRRTSLFVEAEHGNGEEELVVVCHEQASKIVQYLRARLAGLDWLIARIVPAGDRQPASVLARLVETGRATLAERPGYRPGMRSGDGADRLSAALVELRDEERW